MAIADTARLIASLELEDKFSKTADKYNKALSGMERKTGTLEKVGFQVGRGARNVVDNVGRIAVIGAGVVASQVALGVRSLAQLEEAKNQTEAAIKSTGGVANVTAEQVRNLSESLEDLSTVDDKVIQSGANLLLTFTKVRNEVGEGNDIFNRATDAALNLSVAGFGDMASTAKQVGKALNDPIKGVTALRKAGVQLTDQQTEQIKKFVESGDILKAQKVILEELETQVGQSAEAFAKGPAADMRRFGDAVEGAQQALATGFLPVISRVSKLVQDALGDPQVQRNIKAFGEGLAGGVEDLIDIGLKLPWDAIGQSAKLMGQGAKALLDAFTGLPPWIQTAVLTGWGLNKLTGGALGNIGGILTKSLFGAIRGSTPATPVFTKEVGLPGGGTGGAPIAAGGRLGGILGGVGKFVLGPAAAVIIGAEIAAELNKATIKPASDFETRQVKAVLDSTDASKITSGLAAIERAQNDPDLLHQVALIGSNIPFISDALGNVGPKLEQQRQALEARLKEILNQSSRFASSTTGRWSQEQREAFVQLNATNNVATKTAALSSGVTAMRGSLNTGFSRTNASLGTANARLSTIAAKDFSPNVQVTVPVTNNVSISEVTRTATSTAFASGFTPQLLNG